MVTGTRSLAGARLCRLERIGHWRSELTRRFNAGVSDSFKTPPPRSRIVRNMSENDLRKLPNIGPAMARMLSRLGVKQAEDLCGRDPEQLFHRLCEVDGRRHDPCVLDTLTAVVDYANGAPARPWWFYSRQRKARLAIGQAARPERLSPRSCE